MESPLSLYWHSRSPSLKDSTPKNFASRLHHAFANFTECQAFVDGTTTHICEPCPAGQQQLGAGAVSCNACPAGTSKAVESIEECAPCPAGTGGNWLSCVACACMCWRWGNVILGLFRAFFSLQNTAKTCILQNAEDLLWIWIWQKTWKKHER